MSLSLTDESFSYPPWKKVLTASAFGNETTNSPSLSFGTAAPKETASGSSISNSVKYSLLAVSAPYRCIASRAVFLKIFVFYAFIKLFDV